MKRGYVMAMVPLFLIACAEIPEGASGDRAGSGGGGDDDLATVSVALTAVPGTVHCIQVIAAGSSTSTTRFDVAPSASTTSLALGRLPAGDVQFRGSAFDAACSAISGTQASWISDPTTVPLRAGISSTVTLTFRTNNVVTAIANFVQSAVGISSAKGSFDSYMVMADGTVRAAGGVFGTTVFGSNSVTTPVSDAQELAAGQQFYCFIKKTDGSVWCAGVNRFGECGPNMPINDTARVATPAQIPFPTGSGRASHIAAGLNHACATVGTPGASTQLETVYCWGLNNAGQLGASTPVVAPNPNPVAVQFLFTSNVARVGGNQLVAGYSHTCLNVFTGVSCWGSNSSGQIGDGTTNTALSPVTVPNLGGTIQLALGASHTCALRGDGTVRCWGQNSGAQLGDGTLNQRLAPSADPSVVGIDDATQIASSVGSNCVLRSGGKVSCWGFNGSGELGDGTTDMRLVPGEVPGLTGVLTLLGGGRNEFVIMSDRTIQAWGDNAQGSLGDGTRTPRFSPVPVLVQ
jgi:alpha-tubulin suppressor-like RCC1 family protein